MSSLNESYEAFRRQVASQPVYAPPNTSKNATASLNSQSSSRVADAHPKKKAKKAVYPQSSDAGTVFKHTLSQLHNVIRFLKEKIDSPQTAEDLKRENIADITSNSKLYELMIKNPKIVYNPEDRTFQYKPVYPIRSKEDLLNLLKERKDKVGVPRGMSFKELDDCTDLTKVIEELESEGKIMVIRLMKDNSPRLLYWNDQRYNTPMDKEFVDMFNSVKVPDESDLKKSLEADPTFTWDFTSIEDNIEAQKLLVAAITRNDQYRFDDDQKRKLEMLEDIVQQTPSKANHNLNIASVPHPELSAENEGVQPISGNEQSDPPVEPQKKKPGRKPLTNTPSSKRKAQNRAAQRAFRERKERYVKELESKIEELESLSAKSVQENQQLKKLVEKLQDENFLLKQTSFNFEFTPDEATTALDKDITDLVSPHANLSPNPAENPLNPYTPPSSNASDDEPSTPNSALAGESDKTKDASNPSSKSSPQILPLTSSSHNSSAASSSVQLPSSKPKSAEEFCEKLTDRGCEDGSKGESSSRLSSAFTEYRDPTPFIQNIDNPFSESTPLPPLFDENFQEFGGFTSITASIDENKHSYVVSLDDKSKKFLPCTKVWERIQQHPKFDDLEGDEIDQLCAELKSKARCSGNGPVVPEEELEAVLVKLEEK
ncbi:15368_t:CDS:10 [Acaulospora colombiana]|uniref:15368_t:CDS:1 n=1 Tax=Acaulospora colombiana TaxID=27376 RepID=A0ACA9LWJ8_9GLOM|nr:15368_t:CDS:10 [Acaulospora colombiana]